MHKGDFSWLYWVVYVWIFFRLTNVNSEIEEISVRVHGPCIDVSLRTKITRLKAAGKCEVQQSWTALNFWLKEDRFSSSTVSMEINGSGCVFATAAADVMCRSSAAAQLFVSAEPRRWFNKQTNPGLSFHHSVVFIAVSMDSVKWPLF